MAKFFRRIRRYPTLVAVALNTLAMAVL